MFPSNIDELISISMKLQHLGIVGLLMVCVLCLVIVIYYKDKRNEQKHIDMLEHAEQKHAELVELFLKQKEEECQHHQETIAAWRKDRENYALERKENFALLLRISNDSAAALNNVSAAVRDFGADINRIRK
jgi:hypothetical protein